MHTLQPFFAALDPPPFSRKTRARGQCPSLCSIVRRSCVRGALFWFGVHVGRHLRECMASLMGVHCFGVTRSTETKSISLPCRANTHHRMRPVSADQRCTTNCASEIASRPHLYPQPHTGAVRCGCVSVCVCDIFDRDAGLLGTCAHQSASSVSVCLSVLSTIYNLNASVHELQS